MSSTNQISPRVRAVCGWPYLEIALKILSTTAHMIGQEVTDKEFDTSRNTGPTIQRNT